MSPYVQSLITARDNFAAQLAAFSAGPMKGNYSLDGESYSWESFADALQRRIEALSKQIAAADGGSDVAHHAQTLHGRGGHW
jgi:hypothetical protein